MCHLGFYAHPKNWERPPLLFFSHFILSYSIRWKYKGWILFHISQNRHAHFIYYCSIVQKCICLCLCRLRKNEFKIVLIDPCILCNDTVKEILTLASNLSFFLLAVKSNAFFEFNLKNLVPNLWWPDKNKNWENIDHIV